MSTKVLDQLTMQIVHGSICNVINGFLVERESRQLSKATLRYYQLELKYFVDYLDSVGVQMLSEVTSTLIRQYLLSLSQQRNKGGCHAAFRAIRAWMYWVWDEFEIEFQNPIK